MDEQMDEQEERRSSSARFGSTIVPFSVTYMKRPLRRAFRK